VQLIVFVVFSHSCRDRPPHLFFMHFSANDDARKLAEGLKAALSQVDIAKS
jgi:hypothetical protein